MNPSDPALPSRNDKLVLLLLAAVGAIVVYLSTRTYGAGLSPDSVGYICAARHLMAGLGLISYDGHPLVVQPPLYPALLALVGRGSGVDPLVFAHLLNALLFGVIVYLGGHLTISHLQSRPALAFVGSLAVLLSPPLFYVSAWAWSEPLFIALVLLALVCGCSYVATRRAKWLLMLSFSAALAALTRYIGVTLILWGALLVLFVIGLGVKERAGHLAMFSLISSLPIGLWLLRNEAVAGSAFGPRSWSPFFLGDNVTRLFHQLRGWYIPQTIGDRLPAAVIVVGAAVLVAGLALRSGWPELRRRAARMAPIGLFAVLYAAVLVTLSSLIAFSPISERYLSPIYVPLTIVLFVVVEGIARGRQADGTRSVPYAALIIGIGIWLVYPLRSEVKLAARGASGRGYASKEWRASPTVRYFVEQGLSEQGVACYSNGPDAVYILTGSRVPMSPARTKYMSSERVNDAGKLRGRWPVEDNAYLVWFDRIERDYLFTTEELGAIADLKEVARVEDGTIFAVRRKRPGEEPSGGGRD